MAEIDELRETVAALAKEVRKLRDIEEIRRVRYAYFRTMDTANWDEFTEQLAPDFTCRYIGGDYEFCANNRDEFVAMIKAGFNANMAAQHQGHHPEIDIIDDTHATGRWYLQDVVYQDDRNEFLYGTAIYTDRYERRADGWKLVYSEYYRIVEIAEHPPRPPHYTARYLQTAG